MKRRSKIWPIAAAVVAALFVVFLINDYYQEKEYKRQQFLFSKVKTGMHPVEVKNILGKPDTVYSVSWDSSHYFFDYGSRNSGLVSTAPCVEFDSKADTVIYVSFGD